MPKKDKFFMDNNTEIKYLAENGNVIQILELWLKFLNNLEQQVENEVNEFDNMFEM